MNTMRKAIMCLLLLAALFLVTAAPRGGGFSGGFGGGRSYGGGSAGRSYGGGYGGGYSGGYRGGYGGSGIFIFGGPHRYGSGAGVILLLAVGGIIVAFVAGSAIMGWLNSRYGIVSVALNLRHGDRYARKLDSIVSESDFLSPAGRATALHRIAKAIDPEDVVEGVVTIRDRNSDKESAGQKAEVLAREQMRHIGIDPGAVNVTGDQGVSVKIDAPSANGSGPDHGEACVLALVLTMPRSALQSFRSGDGQDALAALTTLSTLRGSEFDAFYFYYAPNAAEPLDPVAANRLFLDLRATMGAAS